MSNSYNSMIQRLFDQVSAMEDIGCEVSARQFEPVTEFEINRTEKELDIRFPKSLRNALSSMRLRFSWEFMQRETPEELEYTTSGLLTWHLEYLIDMHMALVSHVEDVICAPKNNADRLWLNKIGLFGTDDGDYVALDAAQGDDPPVVFLSMDADTHGVVLADDLQSFFTNWFDLLCVGPGMSEWLPFTDDFTGHLDSGCTQAKDWKAWLFDI
jgi:hypothetical protein